MLSSPTTSQRAILITCLSNSYRACRISGGFTKRMIVITILLISVLIAVLYVGMAIYQHPQLPTSISHMVFDLQRPYQFVWTLFIGSMAFGICPSLLEVLDGSPFQFVGFLTIASLAFVGVMPLIKHDPNTAHNILAVAAGIGSQLCVLLICPWWLLIWSLFLVVVLFPVRILEGKGIFILELLCYITLISSVLCQIL